MIDFYTDWCMPCKMMDTFTFKDKEMVDYFKKENYVLIKVNPEKDEAAGKKFDIKGYPTLLVFDKKGKVIDRIVGAKNAKEMIKLLSGFQKGIGTFQDYLKQYDKSKGKATKKNFEILFALIDKYSSRAQSKEAFALLDEVIRLDKDNTFNKAAKAMDTKAMIYCRSKQIDKGVETFLARAYPKSKYT